MPKSTPLVLGIAREGNIGKGNIDLQCPKVMRAVKARIARVIIVKDGDTVCLAERSGKRDKVMSWREKEVSWREKEAAAKSL